MPPDADVATLSFEAALAELEQLITRLERGDVDLDEAVACYQRGSALAQRCAALLDKTEATVMQLVVGAGGVEEERPFTPLAVADEAGSPRPSPRAAGNERPVAPPPPGSPARARSVPPPDAPARPAPEPAPPVPAPEKAPELFPGLDPAQGGHESEGDFDLDDIPF